MATLPAAFDASTVKPGGVLDPVPAAVYNVKIVESEMKATADGKGMYLSLTLEILDGEFAERKVFDNLNLKNDNQTAQEIAYGTLSAICHATGQIRIDDTTVLHGIPMQAKIGLEKGGPGKDGKFYDDKNKVKRYMKIENGVAASTGGYVPPTVQTTQAPKPPPAAGSPTGWQPPAQTTQAPPPAKVDLGTAYPKEAHDWADLNPTNEEAKKIIATRPKPAAEPWKTPAASGPAVDNRPPWERK